MPGKTIQAAGGIVVRKGARALIAVVQRRKDDAWVLPRGKLKRDERPVTAARREVVEETGHRVVVKEFLGAMTYRTGGRSKVVQYWRMDAEPGPSHDLMRDIVAVEWLSLRAATHRLSYPLEKLFLRHAGPHTLAGRNLRNTALKKSRERLTKARPKAVKKTGTRKVKKAVTVRKSKSKSR